MPKLIARWNPVRDAWETETTGLFCEHSDVFSETWPTSGMTQGGTAYELPTSAHHTDGSASSSLLGTPTVNPTQRSEAFRDGRNPNPAEFAASLLPTPTATMPGDRSEQGLADRAASPWGSSCILTSVSLLPTPNTMDSLEPRTGEALLHAQRRGRPDGNPSTLSNLRERVTTLLPTPMASMNGPSKRELEAGNPKGRLETAVELLPTPRAQLGQDVNNKPYHRTYMGRTMTQNLENALALVIDPLKVLLPHSGAPTAPPLNGGSESSDE